MTITLSSFFWLAVTWLLIAVVLELRKQKTLRTLAGNLVTIQVKNQDTADKLVTLSTHAASIYNQLTQLLSDQADDRRDLETLDEVYDTLKKRVQELSDKQDQNRTILEAFIDEAVAEEIDNLEKTILLKVEAKLASGGNLLEQLQKVDVSQLYEMAVKAGGTLGQVQPILEALGTLRKNMPSKN